MRRSVMTSAILTIIGALAMTIGTVAYASCCIPPHQRPLVVTSCGKVEAVYVMTKKGFARHDGPIAIRMAQYVPPNQRVDSGCSH